MNIESNQPVGVSNIILDGLGMGCCLTVDQLHESLGLERTQITSAVARMIGQEIIERVEIGCYQLTKIGLEAIENGLDIGLGKSKIPIESTNRDMADTVRQRAWNLMRIRSTFSYDELAMAADRGNIKNTRKSIQRYMCKLVAADYVIEFGPRIPGGKLTSNGFKTFMLVRNTGPLAPTFQEKKRRIFDHNNKEFTPCK